MCFSDFMQTTCFYLGSFLKKLADNQFSPILIIKGSIYHIKHYVHTTLLEWIDLKLDVKWKYLSCLIFAHTFCTDWKSLQPTKSSWRLLVMVTTLVARTPGRVIWLTNAILISTISRQMIVYIVNRRWIFYVFC